MTHRFLSPRGGEVSAEERLLTSLDLAGRTVFDVGAFTGSHTLFFATRVGPSGRVVTFEPHPDNRATIASHLERLGLTNVDLREVAVGRAGGQVEFVYPDDLGRGSASPEIKAWILRTEPCRRLTMPVLALDDEIADGGLPVPDLIKMDVEGMEYDVLLGMAGTAHRAKPALFIEVHAAGDPHERENYRRVVGWLLEHAYDVTHVESGRRLATPDESTGCYAGEHLYCV